MTHAHPCVLHVRVHLPSLSAGLEWSVPLFDFTCMHAEGTHLQCCLLKSGSNFRPIYYSNEMNLQNIWPK